MPTVLVVDDDPTMHRLVARLLDDAEYEIIAGAADGEAAVAACREHEPDVVVLDHMMPRLTGLDAAEVILAERPDQRIVLFTAHVDRALFDRASGLGIAACVAKTDVTTLPDVLATLFA
jgi:DNA-binding NarL/FixJ family response regulator